VAHPFQDILKQLRIDQGLEPLLKQIPQILCQCFGFARCVVFLAEGDRLEPASMWFGDPETDLMVQARTLSEIFLAEELRREVLKTRVSQLARTAQTLYAIVPIVSQGQALGLLLFDRAGDSISEETLDYVSLFAGHFGLALFAARQVQQRDFYAQLSTLLTSSLDLDHILERLVTELTKLLPVDAVEVRLQKAGCGLYCAKSTLAEPSPICPVAQQIALSQTPTLVKEEMGCPQGMRSGICCPIIHSGETLGVLCINSKLPNLFVESQVDRLAEVSRQAGIAIHNANQYRIKSDLERLKSEFITSISHELRTPLTTLKGFIGTLLKTDIELAPEQKTTILQVLDQQTDRLAKMVDELLDLSRLESGRQDLAIQEIRVDKLLEQAMASMQGLLKGYTLECFLDPVRVNADPARISQVFVYLLDNATKYSPPGTTIRCEVITHRGGVFVRIQDQGIGIAPEDRPCLFQKFQRLDNSLTRTTGGTGLGLYMASKILQAHGGRIWIEDPSWEKGASIAMIIPFSPLNKLKGND
jgi:signal transduction histidine kinase